MMALLAYHQHMRRHRPSNSGALAAHPSQCGELSRCLPRLVQKIGREFCLRNHGDFTSRALALHINQLLSMPHTVALRKQNVRPPVTESKSRRKMRWRALPEGSSLAVAIADKYPVVGWHGRPACLQLDGKLELEYRCGVWEATCQCFCCSDTALTGNTFMCGGFPHPRTHTLRSPQHVSVCIGNLQASRCFCLLLSFN